MKKTGGKWDQEDRPLYFLACQPNHFDKCNPGNHMLIAINEITDSLFGTIDGYIATGRRVLIDSGIFALANGHAVEHHMPMDQALSLAPDEIDGFEDLWDRYLEIVGRFGESSWGYIELDQGGRENKIKTRAKLESLGYRPMPVYHPFNDGWDYFDELATNYDRICLGNVVQAPQATRVKLLATIAERRRKYPGLWIHALGMGLMPMLLSIGTDSADASSWLSPIKWSTWKASASLQDVAPMGERFAYRRPARGEEDGFGYYELVKLMSYDIYAQERDWRHHSRRINEEMNLDMCDRQLHCGGVPLLAESPGGAELSRARTSAPVPRKRRGRSKA